MAFEDPNAKGGKHFWFRAASLLRNLTMAIFTGMRIYIVETKLGPFSVSTVKNMITAHGK